MFFSKENYFLNSIAFFNEVTPEVFCETKLKNPDHVSNSGSMYWYSEEGVFRLSDHWGKAASCYWPLDKTCNGQIMIDSQPYDLYFMGFCKWQDFGRIISVIDICIFEEYVSRGRMSKDDFDLLKKEWPEVIEGKDYLFFEFGYLFSSKVINEKIEGHPNHDPGGSFNVVEDRERFLFLEELQYQ